MQKTSKLLYLLTQICHEGCKYLGVSGYEPIKVSDKLFKDIAKKDDEFTGIIVNIHNEKKIINKEELERL